MWRKQAAELYLLSVFFIRATKLEEYSTAQLKDITLYCFLRLRNRYFIIRHNLNLDPQTKLLQLEHKAGFNPIYPLFKWERREMLHCTATHRTASYHHTQHQHAHNFAKSLLLTVRWVRFALSEPVMCRSLSLLLCANEPRTLTRSFVIQSARSNLTYLSSNPGRFPPRHRMPPPPSLVNQSR